jgi:hypothetical protein
MVFVKKQSMLAKKRRGPKPTGIGVQVVVRWQPEPLDALDKWVAEQEDKPTRAEAIRRLVELGLTVKAPARPASRPGRMLLAANAIDKIADPAAAPEERAQRQRRLTKGPAEFREVRVDRPKAKAK